MNGSGTKENPYEIVTIYDFCSIQNGTESTPLYYKLMNSVDFNDHSTYKLGYDGSSYRVVDAPNTILDGNGYKIRNLVVFGYSRNRAIFTLKEVRNCIFQNFMIQNLPDEYNGWLFKISRFEKSSVNITLNKSNAEILFITNTTFYNSVLSITGTAERTGISGLYLPNILNFDHSWLYLDVKTNFWKKDVSSALNNNVLKVQGRMSYSYITGKIVETSTPPNPTETVTITFYEMYNSYCALDIEDQRSSTHMYQVSGSHTGINFFVTDKIHTAGTAYPWYAPNTNTMKFVKEEDVRTPDYLPDISFPVNQVVKSNG